MKQFLKYFIVIASLLILSALIYLNFSGGLLGVNKTVNWAWDLSNSKYWVILITYSLFLLLMLSIVALLLLKIRDKFRNRVK